MAVGLPEIAQTAVSVDGTERYLMKMADGETVETVWMPDGDGGERGDGSEAAEEEAGEVETAEEAVAGTVKQISPSGMTNKTARVSPFIAPVPGAMVGMHAATGTAAATAATAPTLARWLRRGFGARRSVSPARWAAR
jgi:hypothetical protein